MAAAAWALTEVGAARLGDPRRTARLAHLVSDLAVRPGEGIPAACATPAATKAAYRLLANDAVAAEAILAAHVAATVDRLADEPLVLLARHHHAGLYRPPGAGRDRPLGPSGAHGVAGAFGAGGHQ